VAGDAKEEERGKEGRKERRNGYSTTATNSRKETIKNVPYVKK